MSRTVTGTVKAQLSKYDGLDTLNRDNDGVFRDDAALCACLLEALLSLTRANNYRAAVAVAGKTRAEHEFADAQFWVAHDQALKAIAKATGSAA